MASPENGIQHATTVVAVTGQNYIDSLLTGIKWGGAAGSGTLLTYGFPWADASTSAWAAAQDYSSQNEPAAGAALTATQQTSVQAALAAWANVANLTFSQLSETSSNVGDIRVALTAKTDSASGGSSAWGWSYEPSNFFANGGDVWLSTPAIGTEPDSYWQAGGYGYEALIHELGHALGLKHPFEDGATLPADTNTRLYSIMSYTDDPSSLFVHYTQQGGQYSYEYEYICPDTPMLYDIAAIQHLYGANKSYHSGNDVYTFDADTPFIRTIWDGAGDDTISVSNFSLGCLIDLRAGNYSKIAIHSDPPSGATWRKAPHASTYDTSNNLAIAYNCTIENAVGSTGNDTLIGNDVNNRLTGGKGNDGLDGGEGRDTAFFSGTLGQYTVSIPTNGVTRVTDGVAGRDGIDSLAAVERLHFSDCNMGLDTGRGENAGEAYRIYKAAFNRVPDVEGLGFWINALDQGYSLAQVGDSFTTTPEFQRVYGANSSNYTFVNQLYQHVLNRGADTEGFNFWNNALNAGYSRGAVLAVYTECPETIQQTAQLVAAGIQYKEWVA